MRSMTSLWHALGAGIAGSPGLARSACPLRPAAGRGATCGRRLAIAAAVVATAGGAGVPLRAQDGPVVLEDREMLAASWAVSFAATGGATHSAARNTSGGAPGAWRDMVHTLPPSSSVSVNHTFAGGSYDPALQGAIGGIDMRLDQIELAPPFAGAAIGSGFFVRQGGRIFYTGLGAFTDLGWTRAERRCLRPQDFRPVNGILPDFGAGAARLELGFLRSNSNSSTHVGHSTRHGADNWRVVVYPASDPQCRRAPPDLRLEKSDTGHLWGNDSLIVYQLRVTNDGGPAAAAELLEVVPMGSRFRADRSASGWQCSPGPSAGARCTLTLGALAAGASREVAFAVEVLPATPPEFDIFNEAAALASRRATTVPTAGTLAAASSSGPPLVASECTPYSVPVPCDDVIPGWCCVISEAASITTCLEGLGTSRAAGPSSLARPATTADTIELPLAYRFRDRVLSGSPGGRRLIDLYYRHSTEVGRTLVRHPVLLARAAALLATFQPGIRAVVEGRGGTVRITAAQLAALEGFLDDLDPLLPAAARHAIRRERAAYDLSNVAGSTIEALVRRLGRLSCEPGPNTLCVGGGRFRVEVDFQDFAGTTGLARPVPTSSADSGLLWFFGPDNWEMLVKVLDGCAIDQRFWVFAAATTTVAYRLVVTDTWTGLVREYTNPLGTASPSITDTGAFASCGASPPAGAARRAAPVGVAGAPATARAAPWAAAVPAAPVPHAACAAGGQALCLGGDRFRVTVSWRDFAGNTGSGRVVPLGTPDSGLFWFFGPDNWELLVKVLDGCGFNDRFWVFGAATTNVEYTLQVTDMATGRSWQRHNPLGRRSPAIVDTDAFRCR